MKCPEHSRSREAAPARCLYLIDPTGQFSPRAAQSEGPLGFPHEGRRVPSRFFHVLLPSHKCQYTTQLTLSSFIFQVININLLQMINDVLALAKSLKIALLRITFWVLVVCRNNGFLGIRF